MVSVGNMAQDNYVFIRNIFPNIKKDFIYLNQNIMEELTNYVKNIIQKLVMKNKNKYIIKINILKYLYLILDINIIFQTFLTPVYVKLIHIQNFLFDDVFYIHKIKNDFKNNKI